MLRHYPICNTLLACEAESGCDYVGMAANDWCKEAFEGECIDHAKTKCALWGDPGTGGTYYPDNGCLVVWLDQAAPPCDDGNPCTYDQCFLSEDGQLDCKFLQKTGPCDDGDPCTVADLCMGGECVPGGEMPCEDVDDNPCNGPKCVKIDELQFECDPEQQAEDGASCVTEDGPCPVGICQGGACEYVPLGLPDVCGDGLDNDCDGKTDEDCYLQYQLLNGWSAWLSGRSASTDVEGVVGYAEFSLGHPQAVVTGTGTTEDGKYELKTLLPKAGE